MMKGIVFLAHGYPNGCIMYKDLVGILLKGGFTPIVLNFRTGVSIQENVKLIKEVLDVYPKHVPKYFVGHDHGMVGIWAVLNMLPKDTYNIKKIVVLSMSPRFDFKDKSVGIGWRGAVPSRIYASILYLSKYVPFVKLSTWMQSFVVQNEFREYPFDTALSSYYVNLKFAFGVAFGGNIDICALEKLHEYEIMFIYSDEDERIGFVDNNFKIYVKGRNDCVIEKSTVNSHFFYLKETEEINSKIIDFLENLN